MDCLIKRDDVEKAIELENGFYVARYGGFYFESVFQPLMSTSGDCLGFEALVRIKNLTTGKSVNPYFFFQSMNSDIETTNFGTVCYGIHVRNFAQSLYRELKLFINISPIMFSTTHNDFVSICHALSRIDKEGLSYENIIFEVTEFEDKHVLGLISGIEKFRAYGIRIAIDDFGVGFSNEERVHLLKPDFIKFDKSLLDNYISNGDVELIDGISLSKNEDATVIVEGVETREQLDVLKVLNVDYVQGFYFGRPSALTHFETESFYDEFRPSE
ncbi:TPA: EAL domain-containing protein [Vibrio vulnificus]|nr:EAL domain-containing protein [Vibrio vulnificus]MCU8114276.1 EAL domain-containing protein [Vibrio vulnificus]MCU8306064.1 EAL domain-containing protein [Vibrio vulnificus]HDY7734958.1 EAL domain-containing protein [Vibrio vulnificus]